MTEQQELERAVGSLPPGWAFVRAKYLLDEVDDRSVDGSETLFALSKERGLVRRSSVTDSEPRADSLVGYRRFMAGDIVMNKMQAWNGVFGLASSEGIISPDYSVFRLIPRQADPRYLAYLLRTSTYSGMFAWKSRGIGTAFLRLHPELLLSMPLIHPPAETQVQIANFLDRETTRIDRLLEKKEMLRDRMKERHRLFVSHVITGGREREQGTAVRPLRDFVNVRLGRARSPEKAEGGYMVPYLRAANVKEGFLDLTEIKEMNFTPQEQRIYGLRVGDVLVTEGAGSLNAVGASAVWNGELAGVVCFQNHLLRLRPRGEAMSPRYLEWWARHAHGSGLFAAVATGANIFNLGADEVRSIRFAFPNRHTQDRIAERLVAKTREMSELKERLDRQLALLREHRQALITAAVTGQLEVPNAAA